MKNLLDKAIDGAIPLKAMTLNQLEAYQGEAGTVIANQLNHQGFKAEFGSKALVYGEDGNPREVLVGIENSPDDPRATVQLFALLAMSLAPADYSAATADWDGYNLDQAALGWGLGYYKFSKYLKEETRESARLFTEGVNAASLKNRLRAVFLARDLINTPAGDLGTEELCAQAGKIAARHNATFDMVMGEKLIQEYPAIYAVGKGSHRPPALIDLRWGSEAHPKLTLVGKGVVFDSGGLDIKGAAGMLLMKKDMGGAAVTLALAELIMRAKLPVRLRLLIPTVENAVSAEAFRPGDVVTTRKGLTVEIGNTDAEGRMILCDALADAADESPDLLIDMATLTGAARVALGQDLPAYYTHDDELAGEVEKAAREVADPLWRMPLWAPYLTNMKSPISDLNNISNNSMGGSITAALFLNEFVKPFRNWIHFDIYGWRTDNIPGTPKGGEASALRAVFRMLENRYT